MKKILVGIVLLTSCVKNSSFEPAPTIASSPTTTLIASGSLDIQTDNANIASLGIVNYRSSYELCGTSGEGLITPIILPLQDSTVFPNSILRDGDSLSAIIQLDTTFIKSYSIKLIINQNGSTIFSKVSTDVTGFSQNFLFSNGNRYEFLATVY
jgi:hypothetical protein